MLFGFVCCVCCRNSPNNPLLFDALGASRAEGVRGGVDGLDYIFIRIPSALSVEQIMVTLAAFNIHPTRLSNGAPEILTLGTCTREQRRAFFRHIKLHRTRYHSGLENPEADAPSSSSSPSYWYWLRPPLDTSGHPLPPPVGAYDIDTTPSNLWRQYWDRCPSGEYCTRAILD